MRNVVRYIATALGLVLVIGVLAGVKISQISKLIAFGEQAQASGPPPEAVGTAVAQISPVQSTLTTVGTVMSAQGVTVSTEVPGVVVKLGFQSGEQVKAGDVLVRLDTKVEKAQLAAAQARLELAKTNIERTRTLVNSGAVSSQQADDDESSLKAARSDVDALRAQIALKTIRAPFSGRLGIRQVNLGQYLSPGDPVAILETEESLFVDFTLPQQQLGTVSVGVPVAIDFDAHAGKPIEGRIDAIEPVIDATTRQLSIRASVSNADEQLRKGMFVNVSVIVGEQKPSVMVPATAIVYASYGDSVFIVEPSDDSEIKTVRQSFVRLGAELGDYVVIEEGLESGQEVVVAGAFKLRNGVKVKVDNTVLPNPSITPDVENR